MQPREIDRAGRQYLVAARVYERELDRVAEDIAGRVGADPETCAYALIAEVSGDVPDPQASSSWRELVRRVRAPGGIEHVVEQLRELDAAEQEVVHDIAGLLGWDLAYCASMMADYYGEENGPSALLLSEWLQFEGVLPVGGEAD